MASAAENLRKCIVSQRNQRQLRETCGMAGVGVWQQAIVNANRRNANGESQPVSAENIGGSVNESAMAA